MTSINLKASQENMTAKSFKKITRTSINNTFKRLAAVQNKSRSPRPITAGNYASRSPRPSTYGRNNLTLDTGPLTNNTH